jgi:hypothetical protein
VKLQRCLCAGGIPSGADAAIKMFFLSAVPLTLSLALVLIGERAAGAPAVKIFSPSDSLAALLTASQSTAPLRPLTAHGSGPTTPSRTRPGRRLRTMTRRTSRCGQGLTSMQLSFILHGRLLLRATAMPSPAAPDDRKRTRLSSLFPVKSRASERSRIDDATSDRPAVDEQKSDIQSARPTPTQPPADGLFVPRSAQRASP